VPRFAIAPLGLTETEGSTKFKLKGWKCHLKNYSVGTLGDRALEPSERVVAGCRRPRSRLGPRRGRRRPHWQRRTGRSGPSYGPGDDRRQRTAPRARGFVGHSAALLRPVRCPCLASYHLLTTHENRRTSKGNLIVFVCDTENSEGVFVLLWISLSLRRQATA